VGGLQRGAAGGWGLASAAEKAGQHRAARVPAGLPGPGNEAAATAASSPPSCRARHPGAAAPSSWRRAAASRCAPSRSSSGPAAAAEGRAPMPTKSGITSPAAPLGLGGVRQDLGPGGGNCVITVMPPARGQVVLVCARAALSCGLPQPPGASAGSESRGPVAASTSAAAGIASPLSRPSSLPAPAHGLPRPCLAPHLTGCC
jgi:hypothetical protein